MRNKPFPFSVCKECCSSGEGGETVIVKEGNYKYTTVNMTDILSMITLPPNTVTYAYGVFNVEESEELHLALVDGEIENDASEETVLILDFSAMENTPSIIFSANGIKWLNGEPPTIEGGKIYMFSFVRAKNVSNYFFLGIGGEFA